MKIVVGTTLTGFAMDNVGTWAYWLKNAPGIRAHGRSVDADVEFFAAIETDARGLDPFVQLTDQLLRIDADWWTFRFDDGREAVTTPNRLAHIAMGENLVVQYATNVGADWLLFVAADCCPPVDVIPKLLEVNHPLVGAEVPTYCLSGEPVPRYPFPVEEQLISAACIFIRRDVFKVLRWRADPDEGMSDDPAYQHDARRLLGVPEYVRKDCVAEHWPPAIGPIEFRLPNADMRVYR